MGLDFGAAPDPEPFAAPLTDSTDLVCEHEGCTVPLIYAGRGRKPRFCDEHKSSSSRTNSSSQTKRKIGKVPERELESACNNLRTLYETALLPLMLVSQAGAQLWGEQIDSLDKSNHTFLANNPKLVKQINSAGETSGTVGFVMTHLFAIAPVGMVIYGDYFTRGRRQAAAPRTQGAPSPREPDDVVDAVFHENGVPDAAYDIDQMFRARK